MENLKVSRVFLRTRQRFSRKPKGFVFFLFFAHFLFKLCGDLKKYCLFCLGERREGETNKESF